MLAQCVITMPDHTEDPSDFVQVTGPETMSLSISSGNTIVFDSYTPEAEVRDRNTKQNNLSQLNEPESGFSSEFTVQIGAPRITAILCAEAVCDYKIMDTKSSDTISALGKQYSATGKRRVSDDTGPATSKATNPDMQ
jgi:hypothetical protein